MHSLNLHACLFIITEPIRVHVLQVAPEPSPGEKRRAKNFVLRLSTECESTLDILFSKRKETSAVHFNLGQGTNLELKLPWYVVDDTGYTSTLTGTLMMAEATTSLPYRSEVMS